MPKTTKKLITEHGFTVLSGKKAKAVGGRREEECKLTSKDVHNLFSAYPPDNNEYTANDFLTEPQGPIRDYNSGNYEIGYNQWSPSLVTIKRKGSEQHWVYKGSGGWCHSWAGSSYLLHSNFAKYEIIEELSKLKNKELEVARERNSKKIKRPEDATRLLLEELGYKPQIIAGAIRVGAVLFDIDFCHDDHKVRVAVVMESGRHRGGKSYYTACNLSMADPKYKKYLDDIIYNLSNMWNISMGHLERRNIPIKMNKLSDVG